MYSSGLPADAADPARKMKIMDLIFLFFLLRYYVPIGRFGTPFLTPLDFERGPTIIFFVKDQHKIKEKEFPKGVSEKHEF
jgi:hypothetical protein